MGSGTEIESKRVVNTHRMQLFDDSESKADAVSAFIAEHLAQDTPVICFMTPDHRDAVLARLANDEQPVELLQKTGRLAFFDASDALQGLMVDGHLNRNKFESMLRDNIPQNQPCAIYGELVDLLAERGDLRQTQKLESWWSGMTAERPLTVFCGYASAHFGHPKSIPALLAICRAHSHLQTNPRDLLASFLTKGPLRLAMIVAAVLTAGCDEAVVVAASRGASDVAPLLFWVPTLAAIVWAGVAYTALGWAERLPVTRTPRTNAAILVGGGVVLPIVVMTGLLAALIGMGLAV